MLKTAPPESPQEEKDEQFFPVDIMFLKPWTAGRFPVYVKQGKGVFLLYTAKGQDLSEERRLRLFENGMRFAFIPNLYRKEYEYYLWNNLNDILADESIPATQRSVAWYKGSVSLARSVFEEKLPRPLLFSKFSYIKKMVKETISFFRTSEASRQALRLISRGYRSYNHSMGTMVLTVLALQSYEEKATEDLLLKCAIGAMFHDVGKSRLPQGVLDRKPESLIGEELERYKAHPNLGVGLCVNLPLGAESLHCILFHHELDDGSGFPAGLMADSIPFYVKVLRLCDAYDGLTRATPYRSALSPYAALQRLSSLHQLYDKDVIRRLLMVLIEADIVSKDAAP